MNILKVFESPFLRASDLDDLPGKAVTLTFSGINLEDFIEKGKPKRFPVATFSNCRKQFIIKPTNGRLLAAFLGDETDNWIGRSVLFSQDSCSFEGKPTPCIRVKPVPVYQSETQPSEETPADSIFQSPNEPTQSSPMIVTP